MKTVPLHGKKAAGRVALVDDEDYEMVMQYRWHVYEQDRAGRTHGPYAATCSRIPGGGTSGFYMHKLLTGWPRTDHEDHNGLNNQRSNLRPATARQNLRNMLPRDDGSSRYKGVSWARGPQKWAAYINAHGRHQFLGHFTSEIQAARAYDAAAVAAFGEYACPNLDRSRSA